jgi:beta-xylosidase
MHEDEFWMTIYSNTYMIEGRIISMRRYFVIFTGILSVIAFSSFVYLESSTDIAPGWSDPVKIQERGLEPKLAYHNGELWLAFYEPQRGTGRLIKTTHSYEKVEWSSPFLRVKRSPQEVLWGG